MNTEARADGVMGWWTDPASQLPSGQQTELPPWTEKNAGLKPECLGRSLPTFLRHALTLHRGHSS